LRQVYRGTGIPGDTRILDSSGRILDSDVGPGRLALLQRGEPDPRVDLDTRGWKGKSSGGGASSFTLG
jgi:hypothetical protein